MMIASKVGQAGKELIALLLLMAMVSFTVDAWAQAGYIHAAPGPVMIQGASGAPVALNVGDPIAPGAAIRTGDAGGSVLKFADGMVVSLSGNSSLRISQYQFDPKNVPASRVSVELLDGGMRFVGGVTAAQNREALRVSIGTLTIAVRAAGGLDFSSAINAKAGPASVVVAVTTGEIALRTPSGAVAAIGSNQVISLRSGQPTPIPLAAAPAAIQAEMAALRSVALPNNAPVAVEAAARAAAAVASAARAQAAAAASPGNTQLQAAAQSAAERAGAAVQVMTAAADNLMATILEARLSALPATAAGPPPGPTLADSFVTPIVPIPPVVPTTLAALPAAPAGPPPVPQPVTPLPGPALPALPAIPVAPIPPVIPVAPIPPVVPIAPIPPVVTTPGQSGCVGSPC